MNERMKEDTQVLWKHMANNISGNMPQGNKRRRSSAPAQGISHEEERRWQKTHLPPHTQCFSNTRLYSLPQNSSCSLMTPHTLKENNKLFFYVSVCQKFNFSVSSRSNTTSIINISYFSLVQNNCFPICILSHLLLHPPTKVLNRCAVNCSVCLPTQIRMSLEAKLTYLALHSPKCQQKKTYFILVY